MGFVLGKFYIVVFWKVGFFFLMKSFSFWFSRGVRGVWVVEEGLVELVVLLVRVDEVLIWFFFVGVSV